MVDFYLKNYKDGGYKGLSKAIWLGYGVLQKLEGNFRCLGCRRVLLLEVYC
jgi:hypothetical protein